MAEDQSGGHLAEDPAGGSIHLRNQMHGVALRLEGVSDSYRQGEEKDRPKADACARAHMSHTSACPCLLAGSLGRFSSLKITLPISAI